MKFCSMIRIEKKKIKRSMIWVLLLLPVIMWIPSVIHADANFDTQGILITPENNFFIQGFMGMAWFMIPATLIICTVLLNQTERRSRGILKMLSLPVSPARLALAKFVIFTVSVRHTDGAGSDGVLHQRGYCLYHTGL